MIKRYLTSYGIGLLLAALVAHGQGLFDAVVVEPYKILSNAFFVPAVLFLSLGLLSWIASDGQFDSLKYVGYYVKQTFRWGWPRPKIQNYHDYISDLKAEREDNKKRKVGFGFLLVVGLTFLVVAGIFNVLFNQTL